MTLNIIETNRTKKRLVIVATSMEDKQMLEQFKEQLVRRGIAHGAITAHDFSRVSFTIQQ